MSDDDRLKAAKRLYHAMSRKGFCPYVCFQPDSELEPWVRLDVDLAKTESLGPGLLALECSDEDDGELLTLEEALESLTCPSCSLDLFPEKDGGVTVSLTNYWGYSDMRVEPQDYAKCFGAEEEEGDTHAGG
jgi:hypothetical protein